MNPLNIELGLGLLGLLLLLAEPFVSSRKVLAYVAISGLLVALLTLIVAGAGFAVPASVQEFYIVDKLALFYKAIAIISTLTVIVLSVEYAPVLHKFVAPDTSRGKEAGLGEYVSLPLFVCVGMMVMASAKDLITIFVSLELVTVSFYVLVSFMRRSAMSLEAGVKYLILGALSTGLLVYGMAWIYGLTGQMSLDGIQKALINWKGDNTPLLFGAALVLSGLGFKVAAVPFQIWVPDVYQGAPTPTTAFLSVGSKAAGFVVLTRVVEAFTAKGSVIGDQVIQLLLILAGATILVGNLSAIAQTNFKRLLGYSSIAHAGYLLLALASVHQHSLDIAPRNIVAFYLATYLPMTFICFMVLSAARAQGVGEDLKSLKGLAHKSPMLGLALTIALASLAGLPLTAGFMGKMFVIFAATYESNYLCLALAIIGAATGFYYYFKVILAIYSTPEVETEQIQLTIISKVLMGVFIAAILVIGVYPDAIQHVLVAAVK